MGNFSTVLEVNEDEVGINIEYSMIGRHYPATMIDPEEHPEIEINSIIGDDGTEYDSNDFTYEQINQLIDECAEDHRRDNYY